MPRERRAAGLPARRGRGWGAWARHTGAESGVVRNWDVAYRAGTQKGGYDQLDEAAARMSCLSDIRYQPDASQAAAYDALYQEYIALHDYFGRGANDVMNRLRDLSAAVKEQAYAKHE